MGDVSTIQKHACPACGAQAEWNPAKKMLVCPFCGTQSPYEFDADTGKIQEIDLVKALREIPDDQRGWLEERRSVQCQSCKAVMVSTRRGGPELRVLRLAGAGRLPGNQVAHPAAKRAAVQGCPGSGARRHSPLVRQCGCAGRPQEKARRSVKNLYVPYWTFDAQVHCRWTARRTLLLRDRHYRDDRNFRLSGAEGSGAAGRRTRSLFDDEPVAGTKSGLGTAEGVEPFPARNWCPTTRAICRPRGGHYQVVLEDAPNGRMPWTS